MIRRIHLICALALAVGLLGACNNNPVGRICYLGQAPTNDQESIVASPSLDCQSRTCLRVPLTAQTLPPNSQYPTGTLGLCTAECDKDSDCDRVPESPCQTGFTCAVPVVVGPFCYQKFCICKDYIVIPDGGVPDPAACDPTNDTNSCCNLPGRTTDTTKYPNCANI